MDLSGHEKLRIESDAPLIDAPVSRGGRAVFGALLAGAAVAALPASLVELATASLGLSEALPWLAPPLGWAPRALLALSVGTVTAAILLIFGKISPGDHRHPAQSERTDRMTLATAFGWHRLASFARGSASTPASGRDRATGEMKWRRADLHPDAPLPVPLFASRDLPSGVFDAAESPAPAPAPAVRLVPVTPVADRQPPFLGVDFDPARGPVRDLSRQDRPRPLPRSPEPLTEDEVEALRALLRAIPDPVKQAAQPPMPQVEPVPAAAIEPDAPLTALLGRFEKSVEERIAIAEAQDAAARVDLTLTHSDDDYPVAHQPQPAETVDQALRDALEALRVLSEGKRGKGARR